MDEDGDAGEDLDCPSLLCEELEDLSKNSNRGNMSRRRRRRRRKRREMEEEVFSQWEDEEAVEETWREEKDGEGGKEEKVVTEEEEEEQVKPESGLKAGAAQEVQMEDDKIEKAKETIADEQESTVTKRLAQKDEQKKSKKKRGRKQSEQVRSKRGVKDVGERSEEEKKSATQEVPAMSSEETSALTNSCDLSDPLYLGFGGTGLCCPPVPIPLLYSSQPPVSIQPTCPQPQSNKRPHSPLLPHSVPQQGPQPLEMEITQVYSTRRSIRYSTRGRGRALGFPLLPGIESVDSCLLPPAPKKKTRTLYSTDQLEHLEALFQEDHYPDAEKRKVIAASVGVTPQRIMVWFQNRRAKWRKVRAVTAKVEHGQSRAEYSPHHQINPMPTLAHNSKGAASLSRYYAPKLPQLAPVPPSFPTITTQSPPSHSSLLSSLSSPGESRVRDTGQQQLSSQEGLVEYPPRPMQSPPPLRRASLPLFTSTFNSANPTPPLLNTPAHTPPLFLDALEGGSTLAHRETQSLPTDTSLLFDLDYLTSSQQSNTLSYQLQTSYPTSQPQLQPQASLPRMTYLTPSPYLTPNPPESNPTSYLTFGPGGNSTGVVTYSTTGHAYFQSQSAGQILLQSSGHHAGITAYQSYPWGNMYSQPAMHQRTQCPPAYPGSLGPGREHQPTSSTTLPLPSFFPGEDQESLHANSQNPSLNQTFTSSTTSTTTVLPPVSTLRHSCLRVEDTPARESLLMPSQVNTASPESPAVPSCVKLEYDSPREIHSHFHCDFSPIHF
ncbi:rho guanine nucleotide exchange factor 5-like [Neolamprologus brichardi]|uniref:rho guanine nucleotide exchange factor 5-like n=1 Tax=Neolamprologus brichardi TaxID=32507 RepID=UPI001643A158|nr:rho guanine nucleotide exchange factor 5-like [Neolamprologus brichardi]